MDSPASSGAGLPHVFTLRTLADSKGIMARARHAKRAVVVGAGFIGLETAASLRKLGVAVDVVAPFPPFERILGGDVGAFLKRLHEEHGVTFHVGDGVASISESAVRLTGGAELPAELVVVGVGVRPATDLAEKAGLKVDRGILVDERLETSAKGVFAAGDVARWARPHESRGREGVRGRRPFRARGVRTDAIAVSRRRRARLRVGRPCRSAVSRIR
jgi:NAD(P)H-nitrite reductase large subunit